MIVKLVGEINEKSILKVARMLESEDQHHTIILSSHGGSDDAAMAIIGIMKRLQYVDVQAFGYVESAAVGILAAGSRRTLSKYSWVMVHQSSTETEGSTLDTVKTAKQLVRSEKNWNKMLASYTKLTAKQWDNLHRATTYMTPADCLIAGLVDAIE